ncbi:hypothetical protein JRQ81_017052 [Phrynocephalus forsythii]|uniref:Uncharacterized protein n=1 Tax=Phrynocephalus forsythii TaxID=171643 RepID=A0A9Q1B1H7_9SAUR|nr:hypothetical protein JRQ81_017052 [Phrynocephalus forsythii]
MANQGKETTQACVFATCRYFDPLVFPFSDALRSGSILLIRIFYFLLFVVLIFLLIEVSWWLQNLIE